jgi:hypothetical protein
VPTPKQWAQYIKAGTVPEHPDWKPYQCPDCGTLGWKHLTGGAVIWLDNRQDPPALAPHTADDCTWAKATVPPADNGDGQ